MSLNTRIKMNTGLGTTLSVLALSLTAGCSGGYDLNGEYDEFADYDPSAEGFETLEEAADAADQPLLVNTPALWFPVNGGNSAFIQFCWKTQDSKYDTQKLWAREALRDSWEAVSWVRFDIAADCDDGGIPIEIKDQRPGASGIGTGTPSIIINFDYKNYNFFNLDCDGADNQQCISEQIVHEVGHMIGLGHTHEHDQWVQCGDGRVPSGGGGKGDLSIFEIDTTSVMSYCQERADDRALLSPNDILQIQKLYGGWDAPVTHGDNFALHRDDLKFVRMSSGNTGHPLHVRTPNPSSIIQEADGTRNLMTIRKREGSGRIHYGDQVSLQDVRTGEYYCVVDFGSMGMGVVGSTSECFWDILRPGEVGGSEIHVNDPISIRWPTRVGGNWQWLDRRQLRLLGDFRPEGQP